MRKAGDHMSTRLQWLLVSLSIVALVSAGRAQEEQLPFSITISAPLTVKTGSKLAITVKNISGSPIDLGMTRSVEFDFLYSVRDSEGKKAPETPLHEAIEGKEPHTSPHLVVWPRWPYLPTPLSPGQTLKFDEDLAKLFDLKPGTYTVQLSRPTGPGSAHRLPQPDQPRPEKTEPMVTSNTIKLTVTP